MESTAHDPGKREPHPKSVGQGVFVELDLERSVPPRPARSTAPDVPSIPQADGLPLWRARDRAQRKADEAADRNRPEG